MRRRRMCWGIRRQKWGYEMLSRGCILVVLLLCGVARAEKSFEEARAILVENCLKCHGGEKTKGEFDLTSREGLLHLGSEGVNVVAGKSAESRLMKLIRHAEEP